jgi:hypothetical protein
LRKTIFFVWGIGASKLGNIRYPSTANEKQENPAIMYAELKDRFNLSHPKTKKVYAIKVAADPIAISFPSFLGASFFENHCNCRD